MRPFRNLMGERPMTRRGLLLVIGVVAAGATYLVLEERRSGVDISIDRRGLTIDGN
ncbi:hypothetical protein [Stappia indica]|uniref:Uncharacterized protein n=1 Tax=Stappia indica TaxID=538381 RepID=A0A857C3G9_9HYPH|nr:hypothetical protein [Stappia indica]QGZ33503.1 hypothetical protein GH266_02670 [Stappia indica]